MLGKVLAMTSTSSDLTKTQKLWALSAASIFVLSIGFLGFALSNQVMVAFAVGWIALQIFGYTGSLKRAKGDFAHTLFKSQVILNVMALGLLIAVFIKASS